MGADLLCQRLAIHKDTPPNWEAGLNAAASFTPDYNDPNWDTWGDGREAVFQIRRTLHEDVLELKRFWDGEDYRRDVTDTFIGDYYVLIAAVMSWGDTTDMIQTMERLWASDVAVALGFC